VPGIRQRLGDGLSGIDTCFDPMVMAFLDSGKLEALNPGCLTEMKPPPFTISGATVKPAN
jgi:hypothetical protein